MHRFQAAENANESDARRDGCYSDLRDAVSAHRSEHLACAYEPRQQGVARGDLLSELLEIARAGGAPAASEPECECEPRELAFEGA
jgi:hypothetical protein